MLLHVGFNGCDNYRIDVTTLFSRIVTIALAIAISFTVGSSTLNPKTLKP